MKKIIQILCLMLYMTLPATGMETLFDANVVIARTADVETHPKWNRAYAKFRQDRQYFSALYVSNEGHYWVNARGHHSMKMAMVIGKTTCEFATGHGCALYAISYPEGVDPATFPKGVSSHGRLEYLNKFKPKQSARKWGAFAIADVTSSYGYSHRWDTEEEAKAAALGFCEKNINAQINPENRQGENLLLQRVKCRIIDVHRPTK